MICLLCNAGIFFYQNAGSNLPEIRNFAKEENQLITAYQEGTLSFSALREEYEQLQAETELLNAQLYEEILLWEENDPDFSEIPSIEIPQELTDRTALLEKVLANIEYQELFTQKLQDIFESSQKLSEISVFQKNNGNSIKTTADFRQIEQVTITPGNNDVIVSFCQYRISGWIGILFTLWLCMQLLDEKKWKLRPLIYAAQKGRGTLAIRRITVIFMADFLYTFLVSAALLGCSIFLYGKFDPERMIQSVPEFFSVTVPMTTGQFLTAYILFLALAQCICGLLVYAVLSFMNHPGPGIGFLVILYGVSEAVYQHISSIDAAAIGKYFNIAAFLHPYEFISEYHNICIFQTYIEHKTILLLWTVFILLFLSAACYWTNIRKWEHSRGKILLFIEKTGKRISDFYFHVIGMLSFSGKECYKLLIGEKGILYLTAVLLLTLWLYPSYHITYSGSGLFLHTFYENWSGPYTPELEAYVSELEQQYQTVKEEYQREQEQYQREQEQYQKGLISQEKLWETIKKLEAYESRNEAVETIRSQMIYILDQKNHGFDAQIMNPDGYNSIFREFTGRDCIFILVFIFLLSLFHAGLFSPDKGKTRLLICSTEKGYRWFAGRKKRISFWISFGMYCCCIFIRLWRIYTAFGLSGINYSVHSLQLFGNCPLQMPLWLAVLLYELMIFLHCLILFEIADAAGAAFPSYVCILLLSGIILLPAVLYLLGAEILYPYTILAVLDKSREFFLSGTHLWLLFLLIIGIILLSPLTAVLWKRRKNKEN